MIYPKFVSKDSCLGIPAPSLGADNELRQKRFLNANAKMEELGYKIVLSDNILKCEKGRSASAIVRGQEINDMFQNKDIDMLLCAAGGDFLIEILPYIDFELIKKNPKFVAGFSDPTGLLYPITTKCDIATIYGKNFSSFGADVYDQSELDFLKIIEGNLTPINSYPLYEEERLKQITGLEGDNLTEKVYWKTLDGKSVFVKGRIIGGCFDIISELAGTKYDGIKEFQKKYASDGIIWYFDNCEIALEETIRTLWKFNELGYFYNVKCIIFGRFGLTTSYYDYSVDTCLKDSIISKLGIPIIYDADLSHKAPCMPIINGSIATISLDNGLATINFELK